MLRPRYAESICEWGNEVQKLNTDNQSSRQQKRITGIKWNEKVQSYPAPTYLSNQHDISTFKCKQMYLVGPGRTNFLYSQNDFLFRLSYVFFSIPSVTASILDVSQLRVSRVECLVRLRRRPTFDSNNDRSVNEYVHLLRGSSEHRDRRIQSDVME